MHYFIDGYNLLFRTLDSEGELQQQREHLLKELTTKIDLLELNATVVFDAAYTPSGVGRSRSGRAEVVYTAAGSTADDYIVEELRHIERPHQETVVTSDNMLAWRARRCGAKTVDVATFVTWLNSHYRNKLRKLGKKTPSPKIAERKATTRVPPPKRKTTPKAAETPEASFEYYLNAFQENSPKPDPKPKPTLMSDEERYLRLFMKRLKELQDED